MVTLSGVVRLTILSKSLCHTPVILVRTINVTPLLGSNVGKGMPSLQLQQYNALPAHYIRPSDIILSRLCFPGSCLKNPAYQCINRSPPRQGVACRPGLSWRRPTLINNTITAFFLYHVCYRVHVWLLREGVVNSQAILP